MSTKGADLMALRQLVASMLECHANIDRAVTQLTQELDGLPWAGPDRERFVQEWAQHASYLRGVSTALSTTAGAARVHADQQEAVSGGYA